MRPDAETGDPPVIEITRAGEGPLLGFSKPIRNGDYTNAIVGPDNTFYVAAQFATSKVYTTSSGYKQNWGSAPPPPPPTHPAPVIHFKFVTGALHSLHLRKGSPPLVQLFDYRGHVFENASSPHSVTSPSFRGPHWGGVFPRVSLLRPRPVNLYIMLG